MTDLPEPESKTRYATLILSCLALIYAVLAGLHTLQDFDLGWQLATGRWVLQHHHVFSADVFSHTANGASWIYPVFSGVIFYFVYQAGGYALLSWMGGLASAATVALLLRPKSFFTAILAFIAVPLIASRTQPRAEMFTTIFFAAFLTLLWGRYRDGGKHALWLLPPLMVAWANLHPGFVAGLALCCAYVGVELLDRRGNRSIVRARLRESAPWLGLTFTATLANPWGIFIYRAVARQQQAQNLHTLWVVEWENVRPSWGSLWQALDLRDPQSFYWWLLAIAVGCAALALYRKQWGTALFLLLSAYLSLRHIRLQALFACVTVIVGGAVLEALIFADPLRREVSSAVRGKLKAHSSGLKAHVWKSTTILLLTFASTLLAGIRCWDLVTNRYYLKPSQLSLFGPGVSWWFPQRAVDFLQANKLPANIFNNYNLGGYLTWRLHPEYLDYIDSRALPFGSQLFFRAYELSSQGPDSRAWQEETEARNLNTIIVSLARFDGLAFFPRLAEFCRSQAWRPVYMDEVSAIFVRRTPQTEAMINRLQIDCDKISLSIPGNQDGYGSWRSRAELFNSLSNAAEILYALGRDPEALADLDRAQSIFSGSAKLHLTRALVLDHIRHFSEAESEFRTSLGLESSDEAWLDLGLFYMTQKRYPDAITIFRQSAQSAARPHDAWMLLGQSYLQIAQPRPALDAFEKAGASSPFGGEEKSIGSAFGSMVATGRAKAWYQLGDLPRAVSFQEDAVRLAPDDPKLWLGLADLYDAQGRADLATQARGHATTR